MQYNECETCGANGGRAGMLISTGGSPHECVNCHDTRKTGNVVIHANLRRSTEELDKTMAIIEELQ